MPLSNFLADTPAETPIVEGLPHHVEDIHCMMEILFESGKKLGPSSKFVIDKLLSMLYDIEDVCFDNPSLFDAEAAKVRAKVHSLVGIISDDLSGPSLRGGALAEAAMGVFEGQVK